MAAKLLHSLADDNPDLQKQSQIGCMTGMFEIFDRQHLISERHNQRRLLPPSPGDSKFSNEDLDGDSSNGYSLDTLEANPIKYVNGKQRASTESSRASFSSSSRSSSFSSLDCGRSGQPEPSSTDRITFSETPSRDPVIRQASASPKMARPSVDIRDVVKGSMYRDSRTPKLNGSGHTLKHNDSSRSLQLSKSVDGSLGAGKKGNSTAADIKESLRVLAKLRDAQLNYNEKELSRLSDDSTEVSLFPMPKDAPRFSYDGREINFKVKDLPRLSLDSRESSARGSFIDSKLSSDNHSDRVACVRQPPTNHSRPSSVVAKLMGLDLLPDTKKSCESRLGPIKMFPEERSPSLVPKSPSVRKESTSPRWKNSDVVMKPVSSSKFPIEPAPWKHLDGNRASPKQASRYLKPSPSTSSSSTSVYGDIETRLKNIEFKQSGKDLRALKQILEAIQAQGLLETTKDEQSFNVVDKRDHDHRIGSEMNGGEMSSNDFHTSRAIGSKQLSSGETKAFEAPIVIMKPANLVQKSSIPAAFIIPIEGLPALQRPHSHEGVPHRKNSVGFNIPKDQTIKDGHRDQPVNSSNKKNKNRNVRVTPTSSRSSQIAKDNTPNSSKHLGALSPRLQLKQLGFDKRSCPPTHPDLDKSRRQLSKQSIKSGSPGGRHQPIKTSIVQQNGDQSREKCDCRDLCSHEYSVPVHSDTSSSLESRLETTGTPTKQPVNVAVPQSPSGDNHWISEEIKEDVSLRLSKEHMVGDLASAPEQPSPVSVLESSAYKEGSPSPIKQTLHTPKVAESNDTGEELKSTSTVDDISTRSTIVELPSEISRKKLQSIDNLVQKLRRLNSTHDEAQTDYFALLCENSNPNHRYIFEILLTSGLLLTELSSGLTAFQLHPSGHPINPELFFVLEQTKASSLLAKGDNVDAACMSNSRCEKYHRKLIFDAVNEILAQKLAMLSPPLESWLKPEKLAKKTLNAQKLLRELCLEIELLQASKQDCSLVDEDGLKNILWEDVIQRTDNWTDFKAEFSSIVLDVERSIFKNLVDEIVIDEAAHLGRKPNRRRLLFSK